jgi:hypothetical protein
MADDTTRPRDGSLDIEEDGGDKLQSFKNAISNDADAMIDQREQANSDMRFVNVTGGMWEEEWIDDIYKNRAKMEFDLVSNYLFRFMAEWNQNRQGVEYRPDDDVTSDDDAELLNGIYRADFRDGSGKVSLDNAVYELATCGYGAFKLATRFEDESDPEDERQRIEWRPIQNAFNTVFWDSSAIRADKRDARWVTVLTEFTKESFREAFGSDFQPSSAYTPDSKLWLNTSRNSGLNPIYVATRYEIIRKREPVFVYDNLSTGETEVYSKKEHDLIEDELRADENIKFKRKRRLLKQSVEKTVFSGSDILEPTKRIAGKWLPIIPIYGYRAYVDGAEWYFGLVRKLKDASRLFNMHMNQLAENAASNGQRVPIFDPKQMPDGIKNLWKDKNNKPYLLAKSLLDPDGNPVHHGPTGYLDPGSLDPNVAASMQSVIQYVQESTGGVPKDTLDPNASGKALRAMMKRENLNTQPVQDNINTGIEWSGVVYGSMAAEIYNQEQMIRTVGQDGTEGREQLLRMVMDEKTGVFVRANDLRGKKFRAYADVGPQYETLREETVENLKLMGDFLKETPDGAQYIGPLIFTMLDNMEGVGLGPLKDINRRNMILQGLKKPETDEEKQMLAQAQEQQGKLDPQAELMQKMGQQAEAEAQKFQSQARNLDADSVKKVAESRKVQAQTAEIMSEIEANRAKTLVDIRKQVLETAQGLPFGG